MEEGKDARADHPEDQEGSERNSEARSSAGGISFTFQKLVSRPRVKREEARPEEGGGKDSHQRDFVVSLEGREIQSLQPRPKEQEFVVPLIRKNVWRIPQKREKDGSSSGGREGKSEEDRALDREAAEAIMKEVREAQLRSSAPEDEGLVVPLVMQNKPPTMEGREGDELADVELRPEQSTMEEYESMPIDKFGEAMLKGMGWKKGQAIGKTNKGLTEPIEFIPRVGGLGLGAIPRAPEKKEGRIRKPGEQERRPRGPYVDKDGRVRHVKKVGEEIPEQSEGFAPGKYAKVLRGPHEGLYGKIVVVDEDTARVVLRLAINGQNQDLSQHHLELVSEAEHRKYGRGTRQQEEKKFGLIRKNKEGRSPSPSNETEDSTLRPPQHTESLHGANSSERDHPPPAKHRASGRRHREDDEGDHSASPSKKKGRHEDHSSRTKANSRTSEHSSQSRSKHKDGSSTSHGSKASRSGIIKENSRKKASDSEKRPPFWVAPNLRVRVVDKKFKGGRFYNHKVVILDVVSLGTCVCQTEDGKLLEDVTQHMLETVVPKTTSASVMVVGGSRKGHIATILERRTNKYEAIIELLETNEVLTVPYDDICEYIGEVENM